MEIRNETSEMLVGGLLWNTSLAPWEQIPQWNKISEISVSNVYKKHGIVAYGSNRVGVVFIEQSYTEQLLHLFIALAQFILFSIHLWNC